MALIFFGSILICLSLIINFIKSVFLVWNLYFLITIGISFLYSFFKTHFICSLYSCLLFKYIIMLSKYAIIKLSKYSSRSSKSDSAACTRRGLQTYSQEQSQCRDASQNWGGRLRCFGRVVKTLHWEGEPQYKRLTTSTTAS